MTYPFLFAITTYSGDILRYIVVISKGVDFVTDDIAWADDPLLPDRRTLRPELDIAQEHYIFSSLDQARDFIKTWWRSYDQ